MVKLVVADDEERVCRLIVALGNWEELGIKVVGTATTSLTITTSFCHILNNAGIYFRRHLTNILIFLKLPDIRCRADDMVAHPLRSQEIFLLVD